MNRNQAWNKYKYNQLTTPMIWIIRCSDCRHRAPKITSFSVS